MTYCIHIACTLNIESGMTDGQQYRFNGMLFRCTTDSWTLSFIDRVDSLFNISHLHLSASFKIF